MKLDLTKDLEHMLIGAERYAFGRRTYIVMQKDMKSNRDLATGYGQHDLEERFYGDSCDMRDWMRFEAALDSEMKRRLSDV